MTFDDLYAVVARCDGPTSRSLSSGARFIRQLPDKGPLAFFHHLPAPADDAVLTRIETELGREIPYDFRALLKRTNGPCLFDKHLDFYGAEEGLSRSLRLEDQIAISLLLANRTFAVARDGRWNDGWMRIGSVSGWSTQHDLQANASGQCAIVSKEGAVVEFAGLADMLSMLVGMIEPLIPCAGLANGEYDRIEQAMCGIFATSSRLH